MISDCQQGKIDIVLFTKLDRWFRSVSDYYAVMEQLGVPWKAIWEDYETETSSGVFKVNIMLSVAQAEADRTSERIRSTMAYKRQKGELLGRVPLGYIRDGKGLKMDSDASDGMSAFFRAYLDYKPLPECLRAARTHGVKLKRSGAYYVLSNRAYIGDFITEAEYQIIQNRKHNFVRSPKRDVTFLFQGLCFCGYCGKQLHAHTSIYKGNIRKHYDCRPYEPLKEDQDCQGVYILETALEKLVLDQLEPFLTAYNAHIRLRNISADKQHYQQQKASISGRLKRILNMYEEGYIEEEEYRQKASALRNQLADLKEPEGQQPITLPDNWRDVYAQLTEENKRIFWRRTVKGIKVWKSKTIEIVF